MEFVYLKKELHEDSSLNMDKRESKKMYMVEKIMDLVGRIK
jgi:hypothetical protein